MTNEEREFAKSRIEYLLKVDDFLVKHDREALEMAIQALSQEPCDDAEQIDYHDDFATALKKMQDYEEQHDDKRCGNCKLIGTDSCYMVCGGSKSLYKPKQNLEPCDDAVSIRKDVLKCRVGKLVVYNVEWLKKHWQMEMDIVCGAKPCDDAISREAVLKGIEELKKSPWATANRSHGYEYLITEALDVVKDLCVKQLPSVTQKSGKWHRKYDRIVNELYWECNKCGEGFQLTSNFCPNCGAKMESEDRTE